MFELDTQEFANRYGAVVLLLPFLPSLAAAAMATLIVRPGQRLDMLVLAAACMCGCFGVVAALLPLLESSLPPALLHYEAAFIQLLPALVILTLAAYLRGKARAMIPAHAGRARNSTLRAAGV